MVLSLNEAIELKSIHIHLVDPAFWVSNFRSARSVVGGFFGGSKISDRTGGFDSGGHSKTLLFPLLESHKNLGTIESNRITKSRQTNRTI